MKKYLKLYFLVLGIGSSSFCAAMRDLRPEPSHNDIKGLVEIALEYHWPGVDDTPSNEAQKYREESMKEVENADYWKAVKIIYSGLEKLPKNFLLQFYFAALIGDAAWPMEEPLKGRLQQKSKDLFQNLLGAVKRQPKDVYYSFKNEYFFRLARYEKQYELGQKRVVHYWETEQWKKFGVKGYYCQGVGASRYAKELLAQGNKLKAQNYAQDAIVAWSQYFSYDNSYYNAYVHYALALGILGYKEEMKKALQHSAAIIGKDLTYCEFQEVIDFVESIEKQ